MKQETMRVLQVSEKNARLLYKVCPDELKTVLEDSFGKEFLSKIDKIESYEDACIVNGESPIYYTEIAKCDSVQLTSDEIIYRQLKTITKAINKGRVPNMLDTSEKKWFPVFKVDPASPSGFVFCYSDYRSTAAYAGNASRLCFFSEADSDYAGKTFTDLYAKYII